MKKLIFLTVFLLVVGWNSQAVEVINLNPSATTINGRASDTNTAIEKTWNFSDSTVLVGSGGGTNDKVYGGFKTTQTIPSSSNANAVVRWLNQEFQVTIIPSGSNTTTATGMVLWNQADFLNGAATQMVSFASGNSLSINFTAIGASTRDFRFVIKQGGSYYVTDDAKTDTGLTYSIDPTTNLWRTISDDGNYTIGGTASSLSLTNIQAVGLYMGVRRTGTSGTTSTTNIKFNDFQADATIVSEGTRSLRLVILQ